MSIGSGLLFSILLLCRFMDTTYCMAMTLISSNVNLMLNLGILNVVSILSIHGMRAVDLAFAAMTMSKSTFHILFIVMFISGLYSIDYSFVWCSIITICKFNELLF